MTRVAVVPSPPFLLPEYAGAHDAAPELRAACRDAIAWLVEERPPAVHVLVPPTDPANLGRGVADPLGLRVARVLLEEAGYAGRVVDGAAGAGHQAVLVVADGSARRSTEAPGYLDDRARGFDSSCEEALVVADHEALRSLDARLGEELWATGVPALQALGALELPVEQVDLDYADDPFGVQYWVVRWHCAS